MKGGEEKEERGGQMDRECKEEREKEQMRPYSPFSLTEGGKGKKGKGIQPLWREIRTSIKYVK